MAETTLRISYYKKAISKLSLRMGEIPALKRKPILPLLIEFQEQVKRLESELPTVSQAIHLQKGLNHTHLLYEDIEGKLPGPKINHVQGFEIFNLVNQLRAEPAQFAELLVSSNINQEIKQKALKFLEKQIQQDRQVKPLRFLFQLERAAFDHGVQLLRNHSFKQSGDEGIQFLNNYLQHLGHAAQIIGIVFDMKQLDVTIASLCAVGGKTLFSEDIQFCGGAIVAGHVILYCIEGMR